MSEHIPKFRAIAQSLRAQVVSGQLGPGTPLPSRRQLRDEYNTSRATLDKAIELLTIEGVLEPSDRNRPPVVADITNRTHTVRNRVQHSAETGQVPEESETSKTLSAKMIEAPVDIASQLDVEPGTKVLQRTQVNYLDDMPVATGLSYYTPQVVEATPELRKRATIPQPGSRELAAQRLNSKQAKVYYSVTGEVASEEERALLQLKGTYPVVLRTQKRVLLENGLVVEVAVKTCAGNRPVSFESEL